MERNVAVVGVAAGLLCLMLAGCSQQGIGSPAPVYRANLPLRPLSNRGSGTYSDHGFTYQPQPMVVTHRPGRFVFVVPGNVARITSTLHGKNAYLLYYGRPKPSDQPFVTVTAGRQMHSATKNNPAFKVTGFREFILNGSLAEQWTGSTVSGHPFCELIVRHGKNHAVDALAIARTRGARKAALQILGSIRWQPRGAGGASHGATGAGGGAGASGVDIGPGGPAAGATGGQGAPAAQ